MQNVFRPTKRQSCFPARQVAWLVFVSAAVVSGLNCAPPAVPPAHAAKMIAAPQAVAPPPAGVPPPVSPPSALPAKQTPTQNSSLLIPHHASLETSETFGTSVQGRPLMDYVLGDGPNVTLIFGAVHGCERNTVGMVQRLREYLLKHSDTLNGCRVIVAPCVNPDGWQMNERRNAHNVDLNRNYPVGWHRWDRGTDYDPGPRPLSEPESRAVLELIKKYKPSKIVSVHGYAHMLLCEGGQTHKLARVMQPFNEYKIKDDIGYPTPGSLGKYLSVKAYKPGLLTLELPHNTAARAWQQNKAALLAAIKLELL